MAFVKKLSTLCVAELFCIRSFRKRLEILRSVVFVLNITNSSQLHATRHLCVLAASLVYLEFYLALKSVFAVSVGRW